ncbi:hypothetical protein H2200_003800 [Cladophialophora chaetospira]|uniref:Peptidase A1 domain-containing protein n=1 Tax=Cladophialophora chaetospira TaxID=386627 RepID=A0AA38XEW2_9EURO|nr:hypothetical protein H2200_003800 [Cladophialophora chaetospira]
MGICCSSGGSTQTPPLLILAVLVLLYLVRAATAVPTAAATAPPPATSTISVILWLGTNSASSQAPHLLLLALLFCLFLLREVAALPFCAQDDSPGYVAIPFTKRASSERVHTLSRRQFDTSLNLNSYIHYDVDVQIGNQSLTMVMDTGSYDIWMYDRQAHDPTHSSTVANRSDLGYFRPSDMDFTSPPVGYYVADDFAIGGISANVIIGVATFAQRGRLPSGVLGLAPADGVFGECSERKKYPGYIDALVSQGSIEVGAFSIFLDKLSSRRGTIIFGGQDPSKYSGKLTAFPIAVRPNESRTCELDIQRPTISYTTNGQAHPVPSSQNYTVIFDTGTPLTFLPKKEFSTIASALGAAPIFSGHFEHVVDCAYAGASGGLAFTFSGSNGSTTISVPWKELVIPDKRLAAGSCRFGLAPDSDSLDLYIFGDTFLRSAYVLYNYDEGSISLAPASYVSNCTDCVQPLRR